MCLLAIPSYDWQCLKTAFLTFKLVLAFMSYDGLCLTTDYVLRLPFVTVLRCYLFLYLGSASSCCLYSICFSATAFVKCLSCASSGGGEKIKDTPSSGVILANNWKLCMSRRYPLNIEFSRIWKLYLDIRLMHNHPLSHPSSLSVSAASLDAVVLFMLRNTLAYQKRTVQHF